MLYLRSYLSILLSGRVMKHQQAVFLQEMGITHWQVRKPALFHAGGVITPLNLSACKLLVICTEDDKEHLLMSSIIHAFNIAIDNVIYCSLAQFECYQGRLPDLIWSTLGRSKIDVTSHFIHSPSLSHLAEQGTEKKRLWEQFCAYQQ